MDPAEQPAPPFAHAVRAGAGLGVVLVGIFFVLVWWLRGGLLAEIGQKLIERDAAVLYPVAMLQLAESDAGREGPAPATDSLIALLKSSRQKGMLAIAVFAPDGDVLEAVPETQFFVDLPPADFLRLRAGGSISRYHPAFHLDQYFANIAPESSLAPVLEVLFSLPGTTAAQPRGFVRYFIDARPLAGELAVVRRRIDRQATSVFLVGATLVLGVTLLAGWRVQRAQRTIAERNARLARANFELTLAAKTSAVGQIASHLIHGLQGSVAGLHAVVTSPEIDPASPAWGTAADYTQRLQAMIQETVALLGDTTAQVRYELSGRELACTIRERNQAAANDRGVGLEVEPAFDAMIDSHRGSLLCLIASNLVQNAIAATPSGRSVAVRLEPHPAGIRLIVRDEGAGIPAAIRPLLFQAGRSGRPGGSGLGLAISRLLARQIGAEIVLESTGPEGTQFSVTVPLER